VVSVRVAGCALDSGVEAEDWSRPRARGLDLLDLDIREPSRPVSLCSVRITKKNSSIRMCHVLQRSC